MEIRDVLTYVKSLAFRKNAYSQTIQPSDETYTANRTHKLQNADGVFAHLQNIQDASADKPSYTFNGVDNYIPLGDNNQFSFGDGTNDTPFSILSFNKMEAVTVDAQFLTKWFGTASEYMLFYDYSEGAIAFHLYDGSVTKVAQTTFAFSQDQKFHTFIATYDGRGGSSAHSGMSLYRDGVLATVKTATTGAGYVAMENGAYPLTVGAYNSGSVRGEFFRGQIARTILFNYALTVDKIRRYSAGAKLDFDDIGGTMANILTGDNAEFETDLGAAGAAYGGWDVSGSGATLDGGQASGHIGNCLLLQAGGSIEGIARYGITTIAGKRYRASVWLKQGTATTAVVHVLDTSNVELVTTGSVALTSSWVEFTITFTATGTSSRLRVKTNGVISVNLYIDTVSVIQLGSVLDLEPEGISKSIIDGVVTNKWLDSSGNGLHGVATGAVPTNQMREYVDVIAAAVSLTTAQWIDGGVSVLPAGEWDVQAVGKFIFPASTTFTKLSVGIGTVTGDDATGIDANRNQHTLQGASAAPGATETIILQTPVTRVVTDGTVTYRSKLLAVFASSTLTADGTIIARRVR